MYPFQEVVWNKPHIFVCINSKTLLHWFTFVFLLLVIFLLIQSTHMSKSNISRELRISQVIRLSIHCLKICPKCLCHNIDDFLLFNLRFDLEMFAFIIKFVLRLWIFNLYSLSIRLSIPIALEFWKRLNISFSNEQRKLDLSKHEIKIKFHLNNYTIKVFSKFKIKYI